MRIPGERVDYRQAAHEAIERRDYEAAQVWAAMYQGQMLADVKQMLQGRLDEIQQTLSGVVSKLEDISKR